MRISFSSGVAVRRRDSKRAVVSGKVRSTTSRERGDFGFFLRAPMATRLSICSATEAGLLRPRPAAISR